MVHQFGLFFNKALTMGNQYTLFKLLAEVSNF